MQGQNWGYDMKKLSLVIGVALLATLAAPGFAGQAQPAAGAAVAEELSHANNESQECPLCYSCQGTLDYRGDNCNDLRRYQCAPGTDCQAHSCTYQGSACYWMCHWEPGSETCEELCDAKAFVPCSQRLTQEFCEKGWGCSWQ